MQECHSAKEKESVHKLGEESFIPSFYFRNTEGPAQMPPDLSSLVDIEPVFSHRTVPKSSPAAPPTGNAGAASRSGSVGLQTEAAAVGINRPALARGCWPWTKVAGGVPQPRLGGCGSPAGCGRFGRHTLAQSLPSGFFKI